jgi:hypothetical protein
MSNYWIKWLNHLHRLLLSNLADIYYSCFSFFNCSITYFCFIGYRAMGQQENAQRLQRQKKRDGPPIAIDYGVVTSIHLNINI